MFSAFFDFVIGEVVKLAHSDAGATTIGELVSRPGLWVRNGLIHGAAGFVAFFWKFHCPGAVAWLHWAFNAYILLQIVQVFNTPGNVAVLVADGVLDVAVLLIGYLLAFFIAMRSVPHGN